MRLRLRHGFVGPRRRSDEPWAHRSRLAGLAADRGGPVSGDRPPSGRARRAARWVSLPPGRPDDVGAIGLRLPASQVHRDGPGAAPGLPDLRRTDTAPGAPWM